MRISTRGRYATRVLVNMAINYPDGKPARKQEISKSEAISEDYLEQIFVKLKNSGIVNSKRGMKGGFALAKSAASITVAEVLEATEGPIRLVDCATENCPKAVSCVTKRLWDLAGDKLKQYFDGVTIADLAKQAGEVRSGSLSFEI